MLTNADITLYNKCYDPATRADKWYRTYIKGVSCKNAHQVAVSREGLSAANEGRIRIPLHADTEDKTYADHSRFATDPVGHWTLKEGDVIAIGLINYDMNTEGVKGLASACPEFLTILSFSDNRDSRCSERMQHWRVNAK